jgi:pilus assembly protein Flp/PilA
VAARRSLKSFWSDEAGATAVEVGVLVVLISIALISALNVLGSGIKTAFNKTSTAIGT